MLGLDKFAIASYALGLVSTAAETVLEKRSAERKAKRELAITINGMQHELDARKAALIDEANSSFFAEEISWEERERIVRAVHEMG